MSAMQTTKQKKNGMGRLGDHDAVLAGHVLQHDGAGPDDHADAVIAPAPAPT